MLKVLQVSSDTNIGGAGKCILTYLKHCDKKNLDVAVVLPKNSLLKTLVEELGFNVFEIDAMSDKSFDIKAIDKLLKVFNDFKPDIVHAHASMSARIAAKLFGAKIVYTRHSVFPPSPKLTKGAGKIISGIVNNSTADKVVAVAEAAKDNVCAIGVKSDKVDVVLNGVEPLEKYTDDERRKTRERFGVPEGFKCAAIVARLNKVKGHKYFVEVAKKVIDSGIKAKFLIAGTGDMEEEIKEMIKENNLSEHVFLLGFLEDITPLMNVIDVQLNCSFGTEATSLSLLEGMSLGKPAVVTDFGGNPGVIKDGENGFVVPTHSSDEMAKKLALLFSNEDLYKKMSVNSENIFKNTFTAKRYAENIDNIYLNLGGRKNG